MLYLLLSIMLSYFAMYIAEITIESNGNETKSDIKYQKIDRLKIFIYTIILHTSLLYFFNEVMSLFEGISYTSISVLWISVCVLLLLGLYWGCKKYHYDIKPLIKSAFIVEHKKVDFFTGLFIVIAGAVVIMALLTVPYNWDSMTYHLTRIAHWEQNGSIGHYLGNDLSQISAPPLAGFINLHVYILSGNSDVFLNLLQTFSYVVSILLVRKISRMVGCDNLYASLAALVYATTPIVFAEALTTQIDVFAGLWLLIFVYIVLGFTNEKLKWDFKSILHLIMLGISATFCYLSKPSVCIGALLFAIWLVVVCVRRKDDIVLIAKSIALVCICAIVFVAPELIRNMYTFGSILDSSTSTFFLVKSSDIRYYILNLMQNIGFNLPNIYIDIVEIIDKVIFKTAHILYSGQGIPDFLNEFEFVSPQNFNHDRAINPIIVWLMVISIIGGSIKLIVKRVKGNAKIYRQKGVGYVIVSVISFVIFCTIVGWYKQVTRYEVGFFAILAPAIMLVFQYLHGNSEKKQYMFTGIITFVCLVSFINLTIYHSRHMSMGEEGVYGYFAEKKYMYEPYKEICEVIKGKEYTEIGFMCGEDSYEYPLWQELDGEIDRMEHVFVDNSTIIYEDDYVPECIIAVDVEVEDFFEYRGVDYKLVWEKAGVYLFEQDIKG